MCTSIEWICCFAETLFPGLGLHGRKIIQKNVRKQKKYFSESAAVNVRTRPWSTVWTSLNQAMHVFMLPFHGCCLLLTTSQLNENISGNVIQLVWLSVCTSFRARTRRVLKLYRSRNLVRVMSDDLDSVLGSKRRRVGWTVWVFRQLCCFELSYSILAVRSSPSSSLELMELEEDMIVWFGALKVVQKVSDVLNIISKAAAHKFLFIKCGK